MCSPSPSRSFDPVMPTAAAQASERFALRELVEECEEGKDGIGEPGDSV
jgi:hypothetical protein